jgi:hypothetical protein
MDNNAGAEDRGAGKGIIATLLYSMILINFKARLHMLDN